MKIKVRLFFREDRVTFIEIIIPAFNFFIFSRFSGTKIIRKYEKNSGKKGRERGERRGSGRTIEGKGKKMSSER